ncbi:MAG: c-type cytochrome [Povalibacter sp.]
MNRWLISALGALIGASAAHAEGDAKAGATVFAQCSACHAVGAGAQSNVGPALNNVVGRTAGTLPGYRYSSAMRKSGLTWDEATLTQYLHGPDKLVPGTKMAFPGIASDKDVADVIAYLKQQTAQ